MVVIIMGRNKLSTDDRIKKLDSYTKKIEQCNNGNPTPIMNELKSIRSKALRKFCAFWLSQLDDYTFAHDYPINELSKKMGVGERTIHDYIKARSIISSIGEVAFNNVTSGILCLQNKLPPNISDK